MINSNNFIPVLYLSYINKYNFKQARQKIAQTSKTMGKKANNLMSKNKFVQKQNENVKEIFINLKKRKEKQKGVIPPSFLKLFIIKIHHY